MNDTKPDEKKPRRTRKQRLEEAAREIREYPLSWVPGEDGKSTYGEIQRIKSGEWEARVYGKDYPNDCARFPSEYEAAEYLFARRDDTKTPGAI